MPASLAEQIIQKTGEVAALYHRLVLLVGPSASGKTAALRAVAEAAATSRINLNLELSGRLMDLPPRQRALHLTALLDDILAAVPGDMVLLDNIEMLFDVALQQDPLTRLQGMARNRTVVAAWNGTVARDDRGQPFLTHAVPGHPEYRRYPAADLVLVEALATP